MKIPLGNESVHAGRVVSHVEIDGSVGEGGGQILRTALTLSVLTVKAFRVTRIRAGRENPGLAAQHLAAVDAAARISSAKVQGAALRSQELVFEPGPVAPGRYQFEVRTAGSMCLVLQTIFLPLSLARGGSELVLLGGTHVPWSPCAHYLTNQWLVVMQELGLEAKLRIRRAGFYPRGGGRLECEIPGTASGIRPLEWLDRGDLVSLSGLSIIGQLPLEIAERQKYQALRRLERLYRRHQQAHRDSRHSRGDSSDAPFSAEIPEPVVTVEPVTAESPGTALVALAVFEQGRACYQALGAKGKRAEKVADEACDALEQFFKGDSTVDEHLADQLVLPLALASGKSAFRTPRITEHLRTQAEIVKQFLPTGIVFQEDRQQGLVEIEGSRLEQTRQD